MSAGLTMPRPGIAQAQSKSLDEYLSMVKRRSKPMWITAAVVFTVAVLAAIFWPPTYRSSATILIEEQQIPADMVRSTITSFAGQQIQVTQQRVMTLANTLELVKKFEVYTEEEFRKMPRMEIMEEFNKSVSLDVISVEVRDPRSGRPTLATIAFSLAYEGRDPKKVQKVTSELVNLYLNENVRTRTEKTSSTEAFLKEEAEELNKELREAEEKLAAFKQENKDALPGSFAYNIQSLSRLESQLVGQQVILREISKREIEMESDLAQMNAYAPTVLPTGETVLADVDRLKALQSVYRRKSATYNANHPDIKKLKREIDLLSATVGHAGDKDELERLLADRQSELLALQDKYSTGHPEVVTQQRLIEQLESQIAQAASGKPSVKPDNPAYIYLDNQLKGLRMEKAGVLAEIERLKGEIDSFSEAVLTSSGIEKEYVRLDREVGRMQAEYNALSVKTREAKMAGSLEADRKGQRFTLIQPAILPEQPISPNRFALLFGGFIVAVAAGFGMVVLLETLDKSIQTEKALTELTGSPPLVTIGYIKSLDEQTSKQSKDRRKLVIGIPAVILAVAVALVLIHIFFKPLDVIWFVGLRRLGLG